MSDTISRKDAIDAVWEIHGGDRWTLAAAVARITNLPRALPDTQCCVCGKKGLSISEDGGPECELHDGRWVCSSDCYEEMEYRMHTP